MSGNITNIITMDVFLALHSTLLLWRMWLSIKVQKLQYSFTKSN